MTADALMSRHTAAWQVFGSYDEQVRNMDDWFNPSTAHH